MSSSRPALFALIISVVIAQTSIASAETEPEEALQIEEEEELSWYDEVVEWWSPRYLVGYSLIAGGIGMYALGDGRRPRTDAMIGPSYDPTDPEPIFTAEEVGEPYRVHDTVSTGELHVLVFATGAGIAAMEAMEWYRRDGKGQRFHDAMVGYVESSMLTSVITSWSKPMVGRLRPDFGARARRHHCSLEPEQFGSMCQGYENRPLAYSQRRSQRRIVDGRKSFFSGHASASLNMATYASLVVGGNYVWSADATARSRGLGIGAQTFLMSSGVAVAATRVMDNRHHRSDVLIGGVLGFGIAHLSYWRRFGSDGRVTVLARDEFDDSSRFALQLTPMVEGAGFSLSLHHR